MVPWSLKFTDWDPQKELVDLALEPPDLRDQAAHLLHESFIHAFGWPSLTGARDEVAQILREGFARAVVEDGTLLGWIGGLPEYDGRVWELHWIVVQPDRQAWVALWSRPSRLRARVTGVARGW